MRTFQEHISVVIPTLNAADHLPRTLRALANSPIVRQIVVADGGSDDATIAVAEAAGAAVVSAERGRGPQLRAGATASTGAWLLFLHADCRLSLGLEPAVGAVLAARDSASSHEHHRHMGAVGQRKTPGRVFKGKRMPGHMGVDRRTVQNLTVVDVIPENNLLLISGSVPGHDKAVVIVRPTVK